MPGSVQQRSVLIDSARRILDKKSGAEPGSKLDMLLSNDLIDVATRIIVTEYEIKGDAELRGLSLNEARELAAWYRVILDSKLSRRLRSYYEGQLAAIQKLWPSLVVKDEP